MVHITSEVLWFPTGDSGHRVHDMHCCDIDVEAAKPPVICQLPQRLTNQCMVFRNAPPDLFLLCGGEVVHLRHQNRKRKSVFDRTLNVQSHQLPQSFFWIID